MKVINFYKAGCKVPDNAVYIGRRMVKFGLEGHPLTNPFKMNSEADREAVVSEYRVWLWDNIRTGKIKIEELLALEGKDVVCFCHPKPCHGDVVVKAVQWAVTNRRNKR